MYLPSSNVDDVRRPAPRTMLIEAIAAPVLLALGAPTVVPADSVEHARDIEPGAALYNFVKSNDHQQELAMLAMRWSATLGTHSEFCGESTITVTAISVWDTVEWPHKADYPSSGLWHERFDFKGCEATSTYNVLLVAREDEKPELKPWYPGSSNVSPQLYLDTLPKVVGRAASSLPTQTDGSPCIQTTVANISITRMQHGMTLSEGVGRKGTWEESWTLSGCGGEAEKLVTFIPDGNGGFHIRVGLKPQLL